MLCGFRCGKNRIWRRWWDSNPRAGSSPTKRFRVVLVTTTSIHLRIWLCLNFARLLQGRSWNAVIQNSRKMKHLRDIARKQELSHIRKWRGRLPFESSSLWPLRYVSIYIYIAKAIANLKIGWKSVRITVRKNRSRSKQELKKSVFKPLLR